MKARCPIKPCEATVGGNRIVCDGHWALLPKPLQHDVTSTYTVYLDTRKADVRAAALRSHRLAAGRALLHLTDKQNEQKEATA